MTTINQLPLQTSLSGGDQFAVWGPSNGDTRRVPFSVVQAAILTDTTSNTAPGSFANKTFDLAANTLRGTLAQFSAACTDAAFASTETVQTLKNKNISLCTNVIRGNWEQFSAIVTDDAPVSAAQLGATEWAAWTPVIAAENGIFTTITLDTAETVWQRINGLAYVRLSFTVTAIGTGENGFEISGLPVPPHSWVDVAGRDNTADVALSGVFEDGVVKVLLYDANDPVVDGNSYSIWLQYRV